MTAIILSLVYFIGTIFLAIGAYICVGLGMTMQYVGIAIMFYCFTAVIYLMANGDL